MSSGRDLQDVSEPPREGRSPSPAPPAAAAGRRQRVIGAARGAAAGPTLLCVAGVHGNEPAGVEALRRVFERLEREAPPLSGEIVGLAGNLAALARGQRFLDCDLNRIWTPARLAELPLRGGPGPRNAEEAELIELRRAVRRTLLRRRGPAYFLDLHTTSSASAPFAIINDTLSNRAFARHFPVATILGFEEHVDGTIADYAHGIGCITMGFESGRHDDPVSVDLHEAAVWVALAATGMLRERRAEAGRWRRRLAAAADGTPRYAEIRHRYPVTSDSEFRMEPGFRNFQPVEAGRIVARDDGVAVRARESARLFMPLYQDLGDDGFFLIRPVGEIWLRLSTVMRRLRLGHVAHWLPGVKRHPHRAGAVTVRPRVCRFYVNEIFHLLGYRRRHREGDRLVFSRRLHDLGPPPVPPP